MRNRFTYTLLGAVLLLGTACEKEIDLDLNGNDNKLVIEGVLTDTKGECSVKLSRTKAFNADNTFQGVSGASVQIFHDGDTTLLTETSTGVYTAPELSGASGITYGLLVTLAGEQYTATSRMPSKVMLDTLRIVEEDLFGDMTKIANVGFKDPAAETNFYRFQQYINGQKIKRYWVRNDDLTNGNNINARLYILNDDDDDEEDNDIDSGDEVTVEMLNIDANVYKYFYSLSNSATGESDSATPANPVSNISGNAIGYFSAHTVEKKTIKVP
jgi:hypothetical protein